MANKVITFTEPTINEMTEVVSVYSGGSIVRVDVFGTSAGSDGSVASIRSSVDVTELNPGQVNAVEQLLGNLLGNLLADNGF